MQTVESTSTSRSQEPHKVFVYLTCLYILTWYLQLGNRIEILGAVRFEFILGSLLTAYALHTYTTTKKPISPLFGPVLFYLIVLFFYTVFSHDFSHSWGIFFNRVVKFAMLALFFATFIRTPWGLKMVVGAFLLGMLKLGQEGFVGWWTGGLVWENQGVLRLHGSVPIYQHPNSFSGMAVGCLPFIYYLFPVVSKYWKALLIFLLSFCAIIIIYTASRTGYVATVGLAIVFFVNSSKKNRIKYLISIALIIITTFFLIPNDYKHRFSSIFTLKEKEGASAETRIEIIEDAIAVFLENPIGVGVGSFPIVRKEMFGRDQDTHNLYLELLTNLGPLGLISFFALIVSLIKTNKMIRINLSDSSRHDESVYLIAVSNAVSSFIYARLFLGLFGMDTYEIYWWFSTGLTISLYNIYVNDDLKIQNC